MECCNYKITQDYELANTTTSINLKAHIILSPIKWETPSVGWLKLNTDGARDKDGNSSYDGIIRGSDAEWLRGFSKHIGISSAYIVKGVLEGLKLVMETDFRNIIMEVDS